MSELPAIERPPFLKAGCVVTSSTSPKPIYTARPSRRDCRCSFPVFSMVVVDLVKNAPASGCERTVMHAGRPAGIGGCEALLAALALPVVAHHQVALHDIDLLPVVVDERLGGKSVGLDLQQPGAAADLVDLVEIRGEDLLVEARRVAGRPFPAGLEIDAHEFEM